MIFNFSKKTSDSTSITEIKELSSEDEKKKNPRPMICLFDVGDDVKRKLIKCGFTVSSGTFGTPVIVPNERKLDYCCCLPNYSIPSNLHEYDIAIVDIRDIEPKKYIADEHEINHTTGTNSTYFESVYPETLFDPRPFGAFNAGISIEEILENGGLLIVFAGINYTINYPFVNLTSSGPKYSQERLYSLYNFMPTFTYNDNKEGKQIFPLNEKNPIFNLLRRYCENCRYHITFKHPDDSTIRGKDPNFIPLLINSSNEIVAYLQEYKNGAIIILPDFKEKSAFLDELLMNELPAIFPDLFPYHTQHRWLVEDPYYLPNEEILIEKKKNIIVERNRQISEIEHEIAENKKKYLWLHGLLVKDSEELVKCVQKFLEWLGLDDVRYMDDNDKIIREEDLQVDTPKGLLVIEVKGLSGTSKDEDCSQINKIKFRRAEERGSFDVYALYIVNHQKHLPPLKRDNPPFKPEQIKDAENEKRGLLTTWQLFNLYFSIESGGITKEEARKSLIKYGLVDFKPQHCEELGKPINVLKDGYVILFDTRIPISNSDSFVIIRNGRYYRAEIKGLQSNDEDVEHIESGEIGINIDIPAKKSDIFLLKRI